MDRIDDATFAARIEAMRPPAGSIGIGWLGQAGFALRGSATTLLIDPYLVESPDRTVPPADRPEAFGFVDAVLATHEHIDHLDLPTWPALAAAGDARFVAPAPIVNQVVAAGIGAERPGTFVDYLRGAHPRVAAVVPGRYGRLILTPTWNG